MWTPLPNPIREVYYRQQEILFVGGQPEETYKPRFIATKRDDTWVVIDDTGWNGFEEVDASVVASGLTKTEAVAKAKQMAFGDE